VNYTDEENAEIVLAAAAAKDAYLGRYIGSRVLEWARGVPIYVREGDEAFEAAVVGQFPGYRVLVDANLASRHIRLGEGPAIPPSAHEIVPKRERATAGRVSGARR
jgi:hypothetical protein